MGKTIKVLVLTLKGDIKYTLGMKKSVSEVLEEIKMCHSEFYQVCDTCAILKSEIVSVEVMDYPMEEGVQK